MKKITSVLFSVLMIVNLVVIDGCKKGCTDIEASNFDTDAKKDDGTCNYFVDLFTGSYDMHETKTGTASGVGFTFTHDYTLTITKLSNTSLKISNIGDMGKSVTATVSNSSAIVIPSQSLGLNNGDNISGTASLNGTTLTLDFTYSVPSTSSTYSASGSGTKQ